MATSTHRSIRNQNSNLLYNGGNRSSKANFPKADERGIGGRKALNDISNSREPTVLQPVKKSTSTNVISVDKDSNIARTKRSRVPERKNNGGRKPLTDVTNSVEPSLHQAQKDVLKSKRVSEENALTSTLAEGSLHNHERCIKSQTPVLDKDYFLSSVGLNSTGKSTQLSGMSAVGSSTKELKRDPVIDLKIETILELPLDDHLSHGDPDCLSPTCKSPSSPPPLGIMNLDDDNDAYLLLSCAPTQRLRIDHVP